MSGLFTGKACISGVAYLLLLSSTCVPDRDSKKNTNVFPIPGNIIVSVLPYESVEEALRDEENIDWYRDGARARACTLAHAAMELKDHLALIRISATITPPDTLTGSSSIVLADLTELLYQAH